MKKDLIVKIQTIRLKIKILKNKKIKWIKSPLPISGIIIHKFKFVYTFLKKYDKILNVGGKTMKINKDMKIGELLEIAPEKVDILLNAGMHCIGCPASQGETLEEACEVHGIDVDEIVEELNKETE